MSADEGAVCRCRCGFTIWMDSIDDWMLHPIAHAEWEAGHAASAGGAA